MLLLLAAPVLFLWLGASSIWDANEAFYVETPRQMVLTGDYLNPSFNGQPRFNKPVLSYWVVAGLYRTFGVSVAVERAGIAAGAAGILFAAFLIGRALGSARTGALASLILITAPRFVMHSRRIFIDVWVTLFMSLALAGFVLAQRHPDRRRRYLVLMYVALGFGVLTKGPVALVLPALVGVTWLALERRLPDLRRLMILPGVLIVLAIVLPWYVADYSQHGWTNIRRFFIDENVGRYTTSMAPGDRNVFFYLGVLFGDLFPWAPLVAVPLVAIVRNWRRRAADANGADALRRLLWLWIVVIVGVYSFSRTKQDLYVFPIAAAVAALVADALVNLNGTREWGARWLRPLFAAICALCAILGGLIYWAFAFRAGFYALPAATSCAIVLGITGVAAFIATVRRGVATAVPVLAGGLVVLNYLFVGPVLGGLESFKPVPALTRTLAARASPDADLVSYNMGLPSFVYYANRTIPEMPALDDAADRLSSGRETWLITGEREWNVLKARIPGLCVADRHPLFVFDAKLASVIDRTPPADVVLVTNRCRSSDVRQPGAEQQP